MGGHLATSVKCKAQPLEVTKAGSGCQAQTVIKDCDTEEVIPFGHVSKDYCASYQRVMCGNIVYSMLPLFD